MLKRNLKIIKQNNLIERLDTLKNINIFELLHDLLKKTMNKLKIIKKFFRPSYSDKVLLSLLNY